MIALLLFENKGCNYWKHSESELSRCLKKLQLSHLHKITSNYDETINNYLLFV